MSYRYSSDYVCPQCGEPMLENDDGTLTCEVCGSVLESWECANSMKVLHEDYLETKAVERFYGLED